MAIPWEDEWYNPRLQPPPSQSQKHKESNTDGCWISWSKLAVMTSMKYFIGGVVSLIASEFCKKKLKSEGHKRQ